MRVLPINLNYIENRIINSICAHVQFPFFFYFFQLFAESEPILYHWKRLKKRKSKWVTTVSSGSIHRMNSWSEYNINIIFLKGKVICASFLDFLLRIFSQNTYVSLLEKFATLCVGILMWWYYWELLLTIEFNVNLSVSTHYGLAEVCRVCSL